MANLDLLVVGLDGKPTRKPSSSQSISFAQVSAVSGIAVGTDGLLLTELSSTTFDFSGKKLGGIAAGAATGEAVEYDQLNTALSGKVSTSTTVNGHALSSNVTVTKSDVGLGNVDNVQQIPMSWYGAVSGVAPLDGGSKIPAEYLPNSVMEYKGAWDASANSPSLADGVGNAGDVYRASVSGTQTFNSIAHTWHVGDFIIYSGSVWEFSPAVDAVASVNGYTGIITLTKSDVGLSNVTNDAQLKASDLDTDNTLAANSDSKIASQKAVKSYVDTGLSGKVSTSVTVNGHALSSNVTVTKGDVGLGSVDNVQQLPMSYLDTDNTLATNSDAKVASQKAIKSYVDTAVAGVTPTYEITKTNDNAGAITVRQAVYVKTNGHVDLAQVGVSGLEDSEIGLVKDASIAAAGSGLVTFKRGAIVGGFTSLTPGKKYYVAKATAGNIDLFANISWATNDVVFCVGRAVSATEISYDPCFEYIY